LSRAVVALFEVLLCSGFPTQLAIGGTFAALGHGAFTAAGGLSLRYVVGLSLIDSVVVIALIIAVSAGARRAAPATSSSASGASPRKPPPECR
jgi:hypothetical protein